MKILFWNTHNNIKINPYIISLVRDNDINILVLAEYSANDKELCRFLGKKTQELIPYITTGCKRIKIFGNYQQVEPSVQQDYYSLQVIQNQYILCGVHLPSDLHGDKV